MLTDTLKYKEDAQEICLTFILKLMLQPGTIFSYVRGVMMTQSGNNNFNSIIANTKPNDRKHPESSIRVPYSYMISVEDRLARFLRRMESSGGDDSAPANQ